MPALLAAPWLVPLLTAVGTGTALGTTAYQLANSPSSPTPTTSANNTAAQQAQQQAQRQAAILAQQGNTQEQTGGSLTPTAFTATSAKAAGVPSDLNSVMQFLAGNNSGSNAPVSGGITTPNSGPSDTGNLQNLSDLLKAS